MTDPQLVEAFRHWRDNLAITREAPVCGDVLHGPALDFVIEQLDAILARAAQPQPAADDEALSQVEAALRHAGDTFYRYAKLHGKKGTDEGDAKACANAVMGEEMNAALEALHRHQSSAKEARIEALREAVKVIEGHIPARLCEAFPCAARALIALINKEADNG